MTIETTRRQATDSVSKETSILLVNSRPDGPSKTDRVSKEKVTIKEMGDKSFSRMAVGLQMDVKNQPIKFEMQEKLETEISAMDLKSMRVKKLRIPHYR